jgi:hypothetical protein
MPREREHGPRRQFGDLPFRRAPQSLVFFDDELRLGLQIGDVRHVIEPLVHRVAIFLRIAVPSRPDEQFDVLFCAEQRVQVLESLADGIENEHDISHPRQPLRERLIRLGRLAVLGMAATPHDVPLIPRNSNHSFAACPFEREAMPLCK